jgi:hypothetical protein
VLSLYRSGALPEGTRRVGRHAFWWLGSVAEVLKAMNVRNWRRKSQDRDQWRELVKVTKVHHGLQHPHKKKRRKRKGGDKMSFSTNRNGVVNCLLLTFPQNENWIKFQ